jgi:hypothetical protein
MKPRSANLAAFMCRLLLVALGLGQTLAAQETNAPATNAPVPAVAATTSLGRVRNFSVPDYFEPPNHNRMKSLLRGGEAAPQPDGRVLIRDLHVETYRLDGTTEFTIRAPECLYDVGGQVASSAGRFEAHSGDGKLVIRGEGFRWQQADATFTISNRVHTVIQQSDLVASKP